MKNSENIESIALEKKGVYNSWIFSGTFLTWNGVIAVVIFWMTILAFPALAQEKEKNVEEALKKNKSTVPFSSVGIVNAKILSQNNNNFKVSFGLTNTNFVQPGVCYGITLVREENSVQTETYRSNYEEVLSLGPGETMEKTVDYQAPGYLNGNFRIFIEAFNSSGLQLDYVSAGRVLLNGTGPFVDIYADSCKISAGGADFKPGDLVSVFPGDSVAVVCSVKNKSKDSLGVFFYSAIRENSIAGPLLSTKKSKRIDLGPGDEKNIEIQLDDLDKAFHSAANLYFVDENDRPVSKDLTAFFSVSGKKLLVLNARLDKDYYRKGDLAQIMLDMAKETADDMQVYYDITDGKGISCLKSENVYKKIVPADENGTVNITAEILKDCLNPVFGVLVKNNSGQIFDQRQFFVESKFQKYAGEKNEIEKESTFFKIIKIAVVVLVGLAIFVGLIIRIVKRKKYKNYKLALFLWVVFLGNIFFVQSSEASTNSYQFSPGLYFSIGTEKNDYSLPSENTMKINVSVFCSSFTGCLMPKQISVQLQDPNNSSNFITVIDNQLINPGGTKSSSMSFPTPRASASGLWNNFASGRAYVEGELVADEDAYWVAYGIREVGTCGETLFDNMNYTLTDSKDCFYGTDFSASDDSRSLTSNIGMSGNANWKCFSYYASPSFTDCSGKVKLDGRCGRLDNKPVCNKYDATTAIFSGCSDKINCFGSFCENNFWSVEPWSIWNDVDVPANFSNPSGTGPWSWKCNGVGGGSDAVCQTLPYTMGQCGAKAAPIPGMPSPTNPGLCAIGRASPVTYVEETNSSFPYESNDHYTWTCDVYDTDGYSLGCAVTCNATIIPTCKSTSSSLVYYKESETKTPLDNNKFCNDGKILNFSSDGSGKLTWQCQNGIGSNQQTSGNCEGRKMSVNFSANPSVIDAGDSVNLSWNSVNVLSGCRGIIINNGVALFVWQTTGYTKPSNNTTGSVVGPHNNSGTARYEIQCRSISRGISYYSDIYSADVLVKAADVFCGTANGKSYCTAPETSELCSAGATASPDPPDDTSDPSKFSWECVSSLKSVQCSAGKYCSSDKIWKETGPR